MRVQFTPQSDAYWRAHFGQRGGALSPFQGYAFQRGAGFGSVFRGLLRAVMPLARSAGRQVLRSGAHAAADILDGRPVKESLLAHGRRGAARVVRRAARKVGIKRKRRASDKVPLLGKQRGRGLGRRPAKRINTAGRLTKRKGKRQKKKDILGVY